MSSEKTIYREQTASLLKKRYWIYLPLVVLHLKVELDTLRLAFRYATRRNRGAYKWPI